MEKTIWGVLFRVLGAKNEGAKKKLNKTFAKRFRMEPIVCHGCFREFKGGEGSFVVSHEGREN